jgi:hypothetical protein
MRQIGPAAFQQVSGTVMGSSLQTKGRDIENEVGRHCMRLTVDICKGALDFNCCSEVKGLPSRRLPSQC